MNTMRKAMAFVLASGLAAGALAQQGPFYGGIGYQNMSIDGIDVTLDNATITGGWFFLPNVALEGSYTTSLSDAHNPIFGISNVEVRHGWTASAVGSLPLTDNISAFARVGWGWHRLQANFGAGDEKEWVDDPVFGAGIRAQVTPMGELRAEWTRLFDDSNLRANGISFSYMHHLR